MVDQRARVHLLCGLPGAGKTTYAGHLAETLPGVRFTLDEWMLRLYGWRFDDERYAARLPACTELIWTTATQVLHCGHDVILDWSQWDRRRRRRWRDRAQRCGYGVLLHYLDVPVETAIEHLATRTEQQNQYAHQIDAGGVRHMAAILEPPGDDEDIPVHTVITPVNESRASREQS